MFTLRRLWVVLVAFTAFDLVFINAHSSIPGPLSRIALLENPEIQTPSHRVHALSTFDLTFSIHGDRQQRIRLKLQPNHDILREDTHVAYLDSAGNVKRLESLDRSAHKVFKGDAWRQEYDGSWSRVGRTRITVLRDGSYPLFEGHFSVYGDNHHVKLRSNYMRVRQELDPLLADADDEYMVVFRNSDRRQWLRDDLKRRGQQSPSQRQCRAESLEFNSPLNNAIFTSGMANGFSPAYGGLSMGSLFGKRQIDSTPGSGNSGGVNLTSTIGSTSGCPKERKVALVGVVTDCTFTASFNSTSSAREYIISIVNSASDVFETAFNITLGLHNLTISDEDCPKTASSSASWNVDCDSSTNITTRLNDFSQWRGEHTDSNAFWTLLSTCSTGAEVGLSWLGQLCVSTVTSSGGEYATGANVVTKTTTEWEVYAHEAGHIFGAVHDCTSTTCSDGTATSQQCCPLSSSTCNADEQYIMNPSAVEDATSFSPCTIGNVCSGIGRNSVNSTCLSDNKGVTVITGQQCGNGIVEDGEECDCGGTTSCANNDCCNASTCKFKSGAVCDDSNDACCSGCQFASNGTVCRASTGECDPAETCPGDSASCPTDKTVADGESCGNSTDSFYCASGQCTSMDQQCKEMTGEYGYGNNTYACDTSSCVITCTSPSLGSCLIMGQNYLDGTKCYGGGKCQNGVCKGSSFANEAKSWINDHKALVIGLGVALGLVILFIIGSCILRMCQRYRRRRIAPKPGGMGDQSWAGYPMQNWQNGRGAPQGRGQYFYPAPPPPYSEQGRYIRYA